MNKIEHEGTGTCARIERSHDDDSTDQQVKWFLKVHKTYKLLWQGIFSIFFFPSFIQVHSLQIFRFSLTSK